MTTTTEIMDLTPSWGAMIDELLRMIVASDDSLDCYWWAQEQLQRIGEHLEQLPEEHKLPMVTPAAFFAAKREILDAC